ncbi:MAG: cell division protein FtsQ/DivIB, partial [Puniceicoccales bacterium]
MAKKKNSKQSGPSTWRNIQQSFTGRAVTTHARKRRWRGVFKVVGGVAMFAALGCGAWYGVAYLRSEAFSQVMAGGSEPVRSVYLETDGVLDETWLDEVIALPDDIELMAVDIATIQRNISEDGQVRSALVERVFPDALRIRISEQRPVLRIALQDASGNKYMRL